MRNVHNGLSRATFRQPSSISVQYVCADTGMVAKTGCTDTYVEYFLLGTVPDECTRHSGGKLTVNREEEETNSTQVYIDTEEDLELDPDKEENIIQNVNEEVEETNTEVSTEVENEVIEENIVNETTEGEQENQVDQVNDVIRQETENIINEIGNGEEVNTLDDAITNEVSAEK